MFSGADQKIANTPFQLTAASIPRRGMGREFGCKLPRTHVVYIASKGIASLHAVCYRRFCSLFVYFGFALWSIILGTAFLKALASTQL